MDFEEEFLEDVASMHDDDDEVRALVWASVMDAFFFLLPLLMASWVRRVLRAGVRMASLMHFGALLGVVGFFIGLLTFSSPSVAFVGCM